MVSYEQRHTFRLLTYWNSIKGDGKIPDISAVSLGEMGDLWDYCFVLGLENRHDPDFQHFGSELVRVFGQDYTGKNLSDVREHAVLSDISKFIDEVWLMESPVSHCGEVTADGQLLRYRSLLAPVSEDQDDHIHYLIGTTNFRVYD